jgi:hypothetical protein
LEAVKLVTFCTFYTALKGDFEPELTTLLLARFRCLRNGEQLANRIFAVSKFSS